MDRRNSKRNIFKKFSAISLLPMMLFGIVFSASANTNDNSKDYQNRREHRQERRQERREHRRERRENRRENRRHRSEVVAAPRISAQGTGNNSVTLNVNDKDLANRSGNIRVQVNENGRVFMRTFSRSFNGSGDTQVTINGLRSKTNYSFRARAKSTGNNAYSRMSDSVSATTK